MSAYIYVCVQAHICITEMYILSMLVYTYIHAGIWYCLCRKHIRTYACMRKYHYVLCVWTNTYILYISYLCNMCSRELWVGICSCLSIYVRTYISMHISVCGICSCLSTTVYAHVYPFMYAHISVCMYILLRNRTC